MTTAPRPRLSRRGATPPFHVMELIKAAAERQVTHGDVISLCAGQPSTPAPAAVRRAAAAALETGVLGYTEATGIRPLREAIAAYYADSYGLTIDPDQVVVTTGSSGGFTALFLAAFDVGDVVVMSRPGYPAYRNTLQALGCRVVELDCGAESRYQPTVAMLDALLETLPEPPAGLVIASPSNPTGTIIDAAELAAIAAWCDAHGTLLISDEIYHGVTFGRECPSAWEFSRSAVLVGSFSKYFSMTGWRVGWVILPPHLVRPVELLLGNLNICAPAISQVAALAAFSPGARAELDDHVSRYAVNRDLLLTRLPDIGVDRLAPPDGAFYLYLDVSRHTDDSQRWCEDVLAATGVALTPGVDFDTVDGRRFVRLCFAGTAAELTTAMDRLAAFVS
ncbi:MAG: aminotransferase class I/II-fold pyridoxal phosphate-dependent enzyme [Dermatophilaceae bacterium]|nr:aminotransferase class I/II-fold pyridoxal phosphate-dependent enzyme [Actinomycetales bacterium]MBP8881324.1 aminotransferase class I/II-fold pyridoxal phosphate-dependent enzyme [Dermatophilaceae bacterium]MBP9918511.1 aminotransferase class I/II-fold pyridoxal phosphate-dependent enzyme [Dermatophilaceae bacterium]